MATPSHSAVSQPGSPTSEIDVTKLELSEDQVRDFITTNTFARDILIKKVEILAKTLTSMLVESIADRDAEIADLEAQLEEMALMLGHHVVDSNGSSMRSPVPISPAHGEGRPAKRRRVEEPSASFDEAGMAFEDQPDSEPELATISVHDPSLVNADRDAYPSVGMDDMDDVRYQGEDLSTVAEEEEWQHQELESIDAEIEALDARLDFLQHRKERHQKRRTRSSRTPPASNAILDRKHSTTTQQKSIRTDSRGMVLQRERQSDLRARASKPTFSPQSRRSSDKDQASLESSR